MIGNVKDVLLVEAGGKEDRHLKVQVEIDIAKPLLRGTMLKFKLAEICVEFRYETLPTFCFYCGHLGHNKKLCTKRKQDLNQNCLLKDQYGLWMRAGSRRSEGGEAQREGIKGGISHEVGELSQEENKRDGVDKEIELLASQEGSLVVSKAESVLGRGWSLRNSGIVRRMINQQIGMEAKVSEGERAE